MQTLWSVSKPGSLVDCNLLAVQAAILGSGLAHTRSVGRTSAGPRGHDASGAGAPPNGSGGERQRPNSQHLVQDGRQESKLTCGLSRRCPPPPPVSLPRRQKKVSQAARKAAAAAAARFPASVPLSKVPALELLKGDFDGDLFLELQTRLAKPKVVPPKQKEDALLRKRIEKDKAKDLQAKVD